MTVLNVPYMLLPQAVPTVVVKSSGMASKPKAPCIVAHIVHIKKGSQMSKIGHKYRISTVISPGGLDAKQENH